MSQLQQYLDDCVARSVPDVSGLRLHRQWSEADLADAERDVLAREGRAEEYRIHRTCIDIIQRKACVRCWLQRHCCICQRTSPTQPGEAAPHPPPSPHRVVVLMHHTEYGRASNTGKLLLLVAQPPSPPTPLSSIITFQPSSPLSDPLLSPSPSIPPPPHPLLLIDGIPAHNAALQRLCDDDPHGRRTFVLYPSQDAIDLDEWMAIHGTAADAPLANSSADTPHAAPSYTVIVVDGTYGQAATLVKRVPPHIRRVKLRLDAPNPALAAYTAAVEMKVAAYKQRQQNSHAGDDPHRVGKQWTAPPSPSSLSSSSAASSSVPFASFFTALRQQPQMDRVSTVEAVVLCLQRLDGVLRERLLDGLLVLVDALRLQVGLYQMYGQFSEGEVEAMREARRRLYSTEVQREAARKRQRIHGGGRGGGQGEKARVSQTRCRAYNTREGCRRAECARQHTCSACAQPHPQYLCTLSDNTAQPDQSCANG